MDIQDTLKIMLKGAADGTPPHEIIEKLEQIQRENRPMRIKLGLDPSAPDIHLGHTVVLRKIRQLQDLGHRAIIVIGDFTGMIGDPTGKSKTRKQLTPQQVKENAETYQKQIFKVLNPEQTEVRYNSEWLGKMTFREVIDLAAKTTVARMLERDDFQKRYTNKQPISVHEFFYPLMQAYDSVVLHADLELGGTDQTFNILMGRTIQKDFGPDNLIIKYYDLVTDVHPDTVAKIRARLADGANPRDVKMELAREITRLYHSAEETDRAEEHFKTAYQRQQVPTDAMVLSLATGAGLDKAQAFIEILFSSQKYKSKSELRRLITQGAVKVNGERITDPNAVPVLTPDSYIQVGKGTFFRLA